MTTTRSSFRPTPGLLATAGLAVLGLALIVYRFAAGLGAVTNLSDGYPWGFWIGIDILVGIALAGGGFVLAGLVHLFGMHRFHPLTRPAILTALLGYLLFIFALMVDLGRPWNIWRALISWNHYSPMFEVAWCVMFYTFVLTLEFLPAVLERLAWERLRALWYRLAPYAVLAMLTLFTYAMTDSLAWAGGVLAILACWEVLMRTGRMARDRQMPLLLIMAGVMLSTLHQSSLGTLFLITDKLGPLWYTPVLPVLFFLSAVMVGPAMVMLEGVLSARALGHRPALDLYADLARGMPYALGAYLVVRLADVLVRGVAMETMHQQLASWWWWLEIGLVLAATAIFVTPELVSRARGVVLGSLATVLALVVHRTGVALVGIDVPEYQRYIPAWSEVAITVGIFSIGLLAFRVAAALLPIYTHAAEPLHPDEARRVGSSALPQPVSVGALHGR